MPDRIFVAAVAPTTPLRLDLPKSTYEGALGRAPGPPQPAPAAKRHFGSYLGHSLDWGKLVMSVLVPPLVFTSVSSFLCFMLHFKYPKFVWVWILPMLLPGFSFLSTARVASRRGAAFRWNLLGAALCLCAFLAAALYGEASFWLFFQPFFALESLKHYTNVDPSEMDGRRLMDAGQVNFAEGTRVATDMGMSFTTTWDVYCVAPITTAAGLPSQGSALAAYDVWAVGTNCCKSSEPSFACGEYNKPSARAGLRQVGEERRLFFRLAVQQAEAAYNIQAPHPIFFHWVEDPQLREHLLFKTGFESWVMANSVHFVCNALAVLAFLLMFHRPPRESSLPAA